MFNLSGELRQIHEEIDGYLFGVFQWPIYSFSSSSFFT